VLLLLPPSETKRDGGVEGTALDLWQLGYWALTPQRKTAVAALTRLSRSVESSTVALGLGTTQRFEIDRNRALMRSPLLPAIDRYTGVIYDALSAETLTSVARSFADEHLVIGSALFGLLRASDGIPAYRLSHDSRLPAISLRSLWRDGVAAELGQRNGLILDLRSEAYAALGHAPQREDSYYLRVVAEGANGRRKALSHFNKKAKGEFTRAVLDAGIDHDSVESLSEWASQNGIRLERGVEGELDLVV
jgi:cytoplasmic iron level regulating protein YaaA (DUF328/UPF0246 family)